MTKLQNLDTEKLLRTAEILKTIAHPLRLQIIDILFTKEDLSVSQIQNLLEEEIEQSLLSHHLIKLKEKGILKSNKNGLNVYYSLIDKNLTMIFDCLISCQLIYK
jgi:ArsR family transcriptional regulator